MIGGGLFPAGYQQQRDAGLAALRRRRMRTGVAASRLWLRRSRGSSGCSTTTRLMSLKTRKPS